jgi:hypothetical protein
MADAVHSVRNALPVFLTRGRDNAIAVTLADSAGDAPTITAGTIDVWDSSGVKVVDGAVLGSPYNAYTVLAAVLPTTVSLSDDWQVGWNLTIGGVVYTFIQPAHVVRWTLSNPVTEADLTKRHPELSDLIASGDDISDLLTEAWEWVQRRLLQRGRMPWLILDSYALFDVVRAKAWSDCFRSGHASVGGSGKYLEFATYYEDEAERLFGQINFKYDDDEDGLPDEGEQGTPALAPIMLGGPGVWDLG